MYNVSKLSMETKSFLQNLPLITKNNQELISMAAARAISNELILPSSQVESPAEFYIQTVYVAAREIISTVNELSVIDLNRVQELVKTFWLIRYNILFPRKKLFSTSVIVSESHFLGFGSLLSSNEAIFIQQNSATLINAYNGFSQMICEMSEAESEVEEVATESFKRKSGKLF